MKIDYFLGGIIAGIDFCSKVLRKEVVYTGETIKLGTREVPKEIYDFAYEEYKRFDLGMQNRDFLRKLRDNNVT